MHLYVFPWSATQREGKERARVCVAAACIATAGPLGAMWQLQRALEPHRSGAAEDLWNKRSFRWERAEWEACSGEVRCKVMAPCFSSSPRRETHACTLGMKWVCAGSFSLGLMMASTCCFNVTAGSPSIPHWLWLPSAAGSGRPPLFIQPLPTRASASSLHSRLLISMPLSFINLAASSPARRLSMQNTSPFIPSLKTFNSSFPIVFQSPRRPNRHLSGICNWCVCH